MTTDRPNLDDGCEWDPGAARPARTGDAHYEQTTADLRVGAGGEWRLCSSCAALPVFKRYRKREPIVRRP
jgi:hypothetical protein